MRIDSAELALVLALMRERTLPAAAARLGQDSSTVFRAIQRLERRVGRSLFTRSRLGFEPTALAVALADHGESVETELTQASRLLEGLAAEVSGTVRVSTTDALLRYCITPLLPALRAALPAVQLEFDVQNRLVNLTQREADVALRPTRTPPEHMVGRPLGTLSSRVAASRSWLAAQPGANARERRAATDLARVHWLSPAGSVGDHPSVRWRQRQWPAAAVTGFGSMNGVLDAVEAGLGVAVASDFAVRAHRWVALSEPIAELDVDLWLLHHPLGRRAAHIRAVVEWLGRHLRP